MQLYQVILNNLDERSPIFKTREEAVALIRGYANYMKRRGCQVVQESDERFQAIWGGWSEHQNTIWLREIQVGKVPETWKDFA